MNPKKMKVAVMEEIGRVEIQTRDVPIPKDDEVLVKLEAVGVCGSDLHYYEKGVIGPFVVEFPFVLGHEAGGVVVELGKDVKHLKIGDKVALEPGVPCYKCENCLLGNYNLCPDVFFFATPPDDGVFQEYIAHPANFCFKLPDNLSSAEGALIEPLAVAFHSAILGGAMIGQKVLVFGAGCIGLTSMMACKAMGVNEVIVVDIMDKRLDKALELGATHVINATKEDVLEKVKEFTDGKGVDLTFETSGAQIAANQAIFASKRAATVVYVGYSDSGDMNLAMSHALDKELTFKTVFRYRHVYPIAIEAVASGKVDLKNMITHEFKLDDIQNALDECVRDKENIVKGVIMI
jgi:L-iditol 2-dehydrogenase